MHQNPKHFTIPLFIPMQGCPFDCVFCNQRHITGQEYMLSDNEIVTKIESHLKTLPKQNSIIEIGFFGGSFTGLRMERQKHYLEMIRPWLESREVSSIRLSTRPDLISPGILEMLKQYNVQSIELGVQSTDDDVLRQSGRGHKADDVRKATAMIKSYGFSLGLQMMPGLPGDTIEKSMQTAEDIIDLGADSTRIYPTVVVRNTTLETLFQQGRYKPLSLNEAVKWCSQIAPLFEDAGVKILRLGLHPSEGLLHGNDLIAGPFHVAFGEMVYSKIWQEIFRNLEPDPNAEITIFVNSKQINHAAGHKGMNRKMLEAKFRKVKLLRDETLNGRANRIYIEKQNIRILKLNTPTPKSIQT